MGPRWPLFRAVAEKRRIIALIARIGEGGPGQEGFALSY